MVNGPRPKIALADLVKVAIVLACWVAGAILRFEPMPAKVVGGGLLIVGTGLLMFWVQQQRRRR